MPLEAWESLGLVTAAVVAGFFSYVTIVSSKESKLSELRQQWIDALRLEVSILISRYKSLIDHQEMKRNGHVRPDAELARREMDLYSDALQAYFAIQMRINRKEKTQADKKLNQDFLDAAFSVKECYDSGEADDFGGYAESLVLKSSALLKHEWDRVRRGETAYRIAKYFSITVLVISLAVVCYTAYFLYRAPISQASQSQAIENTAPAAALRKR